MNQGFFFILVSGVTLNAPMLNTGVDRVTFHSNGWFHPSLYLWITTDTNINNNCHCLAVSGMRAVSNDNDLNSPPLFPTEIPHKNWRSCLRYNESSGRLHALAKSRWTPWNLGSGDCLRVKGDTYRFIRLPKRHRISGTYDVVETLAKASIFFPFQVEISSRHPNKNTVALPIALSICSHFEQFMVWEWL